MDSLRIVRPTTTTSGCLTSKIGLRELSLPGLFTILKRLPRCVNHFSDASYDSPHGLQASSRRQHAFIEPSSSSSAHEASV